MDEARTGMGLSQIFERRCFDLKPHGVLAVEMRLPHYLAETLIKVETISTQCTLGGAT